MNKAPLLLLGLLGCVIAHADPINISLYNKTSMPIDYNLQLANMSYGPWHDPEFTNFVYSGKEYATQLTTTPILAVGASSPDIVYQISPFSLIGNSYDALSLNISMPNGQIRGASDFGWPWHCNIDRSQAYGFVLLTLTNSPTDPYDLVLTETQPNGKTCTFTLTPGVGPTLIQAPSGGASGQASSQTAVPW